MSETQTAAVGAEQRRDILAECERLSLDYSYYADSGRLEDFANLFADDGELVVPGSTQTGRATILKNMTAGPRGETQSVHAISNVRIDVVSPTEATGVVYITAYMAQKTDGAAVTKVLAPMVVGQYVDKYRKTPEGWRFARRAFAPMISRAPA